MNEIEGGGGRDRTLRDRLRMGNPVKDRFGMLCWPAGAQGALVSCAPTVEAAAKLPGMPLADVRRCVGPLRIP